MNTNELPKSENAMTTIPGTELSGNILKPEIADDKASGVQATEIKPLEINATEFSADTTKPVEVDYKKEAAENISRGEKQEEDIEVQSDVDFRQVEVNISKDSNLMFDKNPADKLPVEVAIGSKAEILTGISRDVRQSYVSPAKTAAASELFQKRQDAKSNLNLTLGRG